jgi:hypothetical protein
VKQPPTTLYSNDEFARAVLIGLTWNHRASYPVPVRRSRLCSTLPPDLIVTMTPLRFASARRGLLAQRTSTSRSRVMLCAPKIKRRQPPGCRLLNRRLCAGH